MSAIRFVLQQFVSMIFLLNIIVVELSIIRNTSRKKTISLWYREKRVLLPPKKNTSVPLWFPFLVFLRGLHSGYYTRGPACPLQVSHMTCATVLSPQPRPLQFKSCCRFSVFNVSRDTRARAQAKREHESNRTHTTATTMCAQPFPTFASCRFGGRFTIEIGHMCFMCGTNSRDGLGIAVTYGDTTLQR